MNKYFIEECKAIVTEKSFESNWAVITGFWELGKAINENKEFKLENVKRLSYEINRTEEDIIRSILFYRKYPDLSKLDGGKAITWYEIISSRL
jgi:hypothetical protein